MLNRLKLQTAVRSGWGHEIKHDGYRIIVRADGPIMRLYGRNAYDWTATVSHYRGRGSIKAKSFTIDGSLRGQLLEP